jgi:hypothetical protein
VIPRLKAFLRILAENCAIAVVPSVFLYLLNGGTTFARLRHLAVEAFVYVNVIVLLAKGTMRPLYGAASPHGPIVLWTAFVSALVLIGLRLESWTVFRTVLINSFRLSVFLTLVIGTARVVFQRMHSQLKNTRLKATEARLMSLEARLHPQFLFNTLNSFS